MTIKVKIRFSKGNAPASGGPTPNMKPETPEPEAVTDKPLRPLRSPHADRLRKRKDGPYYIAPDSVEPLPSGMWANLNVEKVNTTAATFPSTGDGNGEKRGTLPAAQREFLEAGGVAAKRLLRELDRGL